MSDSSCSISSSSWSASFSSMAKRSLFSMPAMSAGMSINLAFGMFLVDEGALQREIDEPGHDGALHDRQLAQDQRLAAGRLQPRKNVARARLGLVDLVDEDDAREADFVELLENELEGGRLLVIGLADDDGGIAAQQRGARSPARIRWSLDSR